MKKSDMNIIDVTAKNVAQSGFFCKMSQKKSPGYQRKLKWLDARFAEGLTIKLLDLSQGGRGFIEYIHGEYAWRPVYAKGYLFIHCLWVVGASKGKGYARLLLNECIKDAERRKAKGVAMVTREGNWLMSKKLLVDHDFECVDQAESYDLMVKQLGKGTMPHFPKDWKERAQSFGPGVTVVRTDQCPYLDDATNFALEAARERGLKAKVVELTTAQQIRETSPSPYGVFSLLLNGTLLSHHYLLKKDVERKLDEEMGKR